MKVAAATDVGRVREQNEDSILVMEAESVFAVADGMGGHRGGEVASGLIVEELDRLTRAGELGEEERLCDALGSCNRRVFETASADSALEGMGSTCCLMAVRDGRLGVAHVGDSRVYLLRNGRLAQVTIDHRAVQALIDDGSITEAEADVHPMRNLLTRSVGVQGDLEIDYYERQLRVGDRVLACSDGLTGMVNDETLCATMVATDVLSELATKLVQMANEQGGDDNISLVLLEIDEMDLSGAS